MALPEAAAAPSNSTCGSGAYQKYALRHVLSAPDLEQLRSKVREWFWSGIPRSHRVRRHRRCPDSTEERAIAFDGGIEIEPAPTIPGVAVEQGEAGRQRGVPQDLGALLISEIGETRQQQHLRLHRHVLG